MPGRNRRPPRCSETNRPPSDWRTTPPATERDDFTDVISDDAVLLHTQYSTQWVALAHVGALFDGEGDGEAGIVHYNGRRAANTFWLARRHRAGCRGRSARVLRMECGVRRDEGLVLQARRKGIMMKARPKA